MNEDERLSQLAHQHELERREGSVGGNSARNADAAVEATRRDWRYAYLAVRTDGVADELSSNLDTAMARVESSLRDLGTRGGAGVWLENESLLAMRLLLETLRVRESELAESRNPERADLTAHELVGEFLSTARRIASERGMEPERDVVSIEDVPDDEVEVTALAIREIFRRLSAGLRENVTNREEK